MTTTEIILGDSLEIMKTIPDYSIDAVITDPPYGLDFCGNDWDSFIPLWIGHALRISKRVLFTVAPTTMWDYPRPDWVACWYRTAAQSRNAQGGFNHWTPILSYGNTKFPVDTYYTHGMVTASQNKGINHPTPKDINMVKWLVENSTQAGFTVLDPFMGSGTTGVACVKLNRNFIGIEINQGYFYDAERRIQDAKAQLAMF